MIKVVGLHVLVAATQAESPEKHVPKLLCGTIWLPNMEMMLVTAVHKSLVVARTQIKISIHKDQMQDVLTLSNHL